MKVNKAACLKVKLTPKNIRYAKKLFKEQNKVYNKVLRKLLSPDYFLPTREEYDSTLDNISSVKSKIKSIDKELNPKKPKILSIEDISRGFFGEELDNNTKRNLEVKRNKLKLKLQKLETQKLQYSINFTENSDLTEFYLANLIRGELSESYLIWSLAKIITTSLDRFKLTKNKDGSYTKPLAGLPKYRIRSKPYGLEFTNDCSGIRQNNKKNRYYIKLGKVMTKLRIVDTLPDYILSNRVKINNYTLKPYGLQSFKTGIFRLIINYEYDDITPLPSYGRKVGIDLGISSIITTSDGEKFSQIDSYKIEKRIEKLQVHLSKKQRENPQYRKSKRYKKLQFLIEKLYAKLANRRYYFSHCISKYLIDKYDIITFEDLKVSNMLKNHNLARSISRAAWNQIKTFTEYKAKYKRKIYRICYRLYPSTKICHKCKSKSNQFESSSQLSIRKWTCEHCGSVNDRDLNAAKNIRDWIPKTNPDQEQKLIQYKRNQLIRDSIDFLVTSKYIELKYNQVDLFKNVLYLLNLKNLSQEESDLINTQLEMDKERKNMRYPDAYLRIKELDNKRRISINERNKVFRDFQEICNIISKKKQLLNKASYKIDPQLRVS